MRTLLVDDDFTNRLLLQEVLKKFGPSLVALNGEEGLEAVRAAWDAGEPFDLICLDIMMPKMDGHAALKAIRQLEKDRGVSPSGAAKILMTTALDDVDNMLQASEGRANGYLVKPIAKEKLLSKLRELELL